MTWTLAHALAGCPVVAMHPPSTLKSRAVFRHAAGAPQLPSWGSCCYGPVNSLGRHQGRRGQVVPLSAVSVGSRPKPTPMPLRPPQPTPTAMPTPPEVPEEGPTAAAAAGTLFGAIALITGSTVGAGMLALPSVTVPAGFGPTATLLVGLWGLLTLQALLMAEVNLSVGDAIANGEFAAESNGSVSGSMDGGDGHGKIVTLRQMAEYTLGDAGKGITLIYLGLAYSLLVAYISKAAEVLDFFAGGGTPPALAASAFVGSMAALLFLGGTRAADKLNQGLTSVLLGLFVAILTSGAAQVDWGHAAAFTTSDWGAATKAVPIIFLSLVYHDLVPVICAYLGGDRKAIRTAIVLGSMIPLSMFLSWEAVSLNLLPAGLVGAASQSVSDPGVIMQAAFQPPAAAGAVAAAADGGLLQFVSAAAAAAPGALEAAGATPVMADVVVPLEELGRLTVDPLQVFVRRSPPLIGSAVEGFSFLAVMTSFIGTTLSLSETLRTEVPPLVNEGARRLGLEWIAGTGAAEGQMGGKEEGAAEPVLTLGGDGRGLPDLRGLALGLTLVPPLLFTLGRPDAFLGVLEACGSYGMTLLYGVIPPLMAWQLRKRQAATSGPAAASAAKPSQGGWPQPKEGWLPGGAEAGAGVGGPFVPGGMPVLAGMLTVALLIGGGRLAADAGVDVGSFTAQLTQIAGMPSQLGLGPTTLGSAALDATML